MPTQFSIWYHGIFIFRLWRFVAFIYFILSFLGNVTMSLAVLRFWMYTLLIKITLIKGRRLYKEYKYYSHQNIYGTAFKIKIPHVDVFLRPRLISFVISVNWLETPPLFNIWCYHSLKNFRRSKLHYVIQWNHSWTQKNFPSTTKDEIFNRIW